MATGAIQPAPSRSGFPARRRTACLAIALVVEPHEDLEILVTARRRAEDAQQIPGSLSVVAARCSTDPTPLTPSSWAPVGRGCPALTASRRRGTARLWRKSWNA